MLKGSAGYNRLRKEPKKKELLTDAETEKYIMSIYESTSKALFSTASTMEWWEFINKYNVVDNHYILTPEQTTAIEPYCKNNPDLEMTPREFINLIKLIRTTPLTDKEQEEITPQMSASSVVASSKPMAVPTTSRSSSLLDSRPRSSKMLSNSFSKKSYYDDTESTSHPEPFQDVRDLLRDTKGRPSVYADQDSIINNLRKEKMIIARQVREYETRLSSMSEEHLEIMTQLKTRLEYMQIETDRHKTIINEQKRKERERLDKIVELQNSLDESNTNNESLLKKLTKKQEETNDLRENYANLHSNYTIAAAKLDKTENDLITTREYIRNHDKEVKGYKEIQLQLETEIREHILTKEILEDQQEENSRLMQIIDQQKYDLDEARNNIHYYSNMDKNKYGNEMNDTLSLATEEIHAEYAAEIKASNEEIDRLRKEREESHQELQTVTRELEEVKTELAKSIELNNTTEEQRKGMFRRMSRQVIEQHQMIHSIQNKLFYQSIRRNKGVYAFTLLSWAFFIYHLITFLMRCLSTVPHLQHLSPLGSPILTLFERYEFWYHYHHRHLL
ncbi:hypothetical protein BDB01DRAFT_851447 [Pilobolus umbonatus]|nr:hypothetical protein BDB01DRAFT_851447 [Pilobolus umbonatus]